MFDFLKKVPLFANLPDADLDRLCAVVLEENIPADEILFIEGTPGDKAYVIMMGEIDILKESGGQTVLLATRKAGEVIGEMSLLDQAPRFASGRTRTDCQLLSISHENLEHLLDTSPSAARVMLSTITNRLRSTELVLRQSEKMAQLGTLTAGIAHELNNPASAALRGSEHLNTSIENFLQIYQKISTLGFSKEQWNAVVEYHDYAHRRAADPVDLDSLGRSDREEELEIWLDENKIEKGSEYAPILVNLGFLVTDLEKFKLTFPGSQLDPAINWFCTIFNIFSLLAEINQGTTRIGEIIKSLKSYVYLDQASVQLIDIHEGLDNTLVMLRSKLNTGITLERRYAEDLPKIQAYGSELNQVWTNLIDNAVDAVNGVGKITIRTSQKDNWVLVEIEDSGPGIPKDVQQKLFSPFFTTKPLGKGTGLGLNISFNIIQKHNGQIKVSSHPGSTRFTVQLPINFDKVGERSEPLQGTEQITDEDLLDILKSTKTIAIVGISSRESSPAYTVSKYLKEQGYIIFPINPKLDQVLGEGAHPDLSSLENPPDLVLIFRQSDFVPGIVDQAIDVGAKAIWMQEGIINLEAGENAKAAGLDVVMDICFRKTHQRLLGGK
jgi:signal transduction histidine kinase/predicted CoA-binding protein